MRTECRNERRLLSVTLVLALLCTISPAWTQAATTTTGTALRPAEPGCYDLNGDGENDLLVTHWQAHLTAFIADGGSLPWTTDLDRDWDAYFDSTYSVGSDPRIAWNPERGNWGSYTLLSDRDDDGAFDSGPDYWYQAIDLDGDGDPDIERTDRYIGFGELFKYNFDLDDDNLMNNIDWSVPGYGDEQARSSEGNYLSDRAGNGFFLQGWLYMNDIVYKEQRAAWENPIAWYDLDDDGCTELVVRVTDTHGECLGKLLEVEVAFDIDNASNPARQSSLDIQVSWLGHQSRPYDYSHMIEDFPMFAGLPEADYLFGERLDLRHQTKRMYFPYFDAYNLGTNLTTAPWNSVFLLVDEDDDDDRWEEMFSPHEGYGYEDHLGDRWESDDDCNGEGQLYIGKFDGRMHLYEAERGEWTIDSETLYKGSIDRPELGPMPPDGLRYAWVRYADTDDNGFIDRITYGEAVYGEPESFQVVREVDLLAFATEQNPHPDVCDLFGMQTAQALSNRKVADWDGGKVTGLKLEAYDRLQNLFEDTAQRRWRDALSLYQAAKEANLLDQEDAPALAGASPTPDPKDKAALATLKDARPGLGYAHLLEPSTLWETYNNAYFLAENVLNDLLDSLPEAQRERIAAAYYTGDVRGVVDLLQRP